VQNKKFEVAKISFDIPKNCSHIDFTGARNIAWLDTLEEAKQWIRTHKIDHSAESWPYVVISYENGNGELVYVEYQEYALVMEKIKKSKLPT